MAHAARIEETIRPVSLLKVRALAKRARCFCSEAMVLQDWNLAKFVGSDMEMKFLLNMSRLPLLAAAR
jgi:hypothetical protein